MEPLFSAVICGCNAGLFREALHEVYIPRIQRGDACFAAKVLGARGTLLSVLVHFFEGGSWRSLVETAVEGQSLTAEDELFILMQAAPYLMATRGLGAPEVGICFERAEALCHSLNHPRLRCLALRGQLLYSHQTDKMSATMRIAERVYSLAQEQNDAALMIGAYSGLACPAPLSGRFRVRATIRKAGCSDLALGKRPVLCGRLLYASCQLSLPWGHVRVGSRRGRL
jgi:hypothetical protein